MTKILNNKYILYAILCVLLVGIALTFSVRSMETASADYQDIINDSTALVNFNQIINPADNMTLQYYTYSNGTYNFTSYTGWINTNGPFNVISGHKYFIHSICNTDSSRISFTNNVDYGMFNHVANYIDILVPLQTKDNMLLLVNPNGVECSITLYLIDISVMFGIGSEPNLQECQDLFVADYYAYNTGSAVSISGLNSYANGYNDALKNTEYAFNVDMLRSMIFLNTGLSLWGTNSNELIGVDVSNGTGAVGNGSLGIRLPSTLKSGDTLKIESNRLSVFTDVAVGSSSWRPDLYVGYYSNGAFVSLGQFTMSYYNNPDFYNNGNYEQFFKDVSFTCTIPVDIDTIYINCNRDFYFWTTKISGVTNNIIYAIDNSYKRGYSQAENLYQTQLSSYTSDTGAGYQSIYNLGYEAGQNASVSAARKKTYTFTNFLGALFDVPVTTLKSLLDFNFLGFNLKNFVFSILTLSIVFAIIKLILVKTGDSK